MACSTLRIRPSRSFIRSRGTLPAASQRSEMSRKAAFAASRSVTGTQRLGLDQELLLDLGVGGELGVLGGVRGVAGAEEGVLRAAEPRPQLLVDVARRGPGGLPLRIRSRYSPDGRTPLGRVGQRLGLLDQPLLDHARALTLLVLLGEVRLAAPGVRRPRGREPPPQRVVGGPVDAGERLPLVEQLAQPVGAVAPVGAGGELLGLGDDPLLARPWPRPASAARSALRASRCSPITGANASSRAEQAVEVADRVGARRPGRARS